MQRLEEGLVCPDDTTVVQPQPPQSGAIPHQVQEADPQPVHPREVAAVALIRTPGDDRVRRLSRRGLPAGTAVCPPSCVFLCRFDPVSTLPENPPRSRLVVYPLSLWGTGCAPGDRYTKSPTTPQDPRENSWLERKGRCRLTAVWARLRPSPAEDVMPSHSIVVDLSQEPRHVPVKHPQPRRASCTICTSVRSRCPSVLRRRGSTLKPAGRWMRPTFLARPRAMQEEPFLS